MKQRIIFLTSLLFLMILIPLSTTKINLKRFSLKNIISNKEISQTSSNKFDKSNKLPPFKVLDKSIDQVKEVPCKDFICGTVALEMSPDSQVEALKAQTVAALTYFCNLKQKYSQKLQPDLKGADFAIGNDSWIPYITQDQMKEKWGENYDSYYKNISSAVDSVLGQTLKKDGEFIESLYHSISSGNTENMKDVFGGDAMCLVSVPSPFDQLAPEYKTLKEFAAEEFKKTVETKWPNSNLSVELSQWLGEVIRTDSGMVKTIKICNIEVSGREIRQLFSLRSSNFDINFCDNKFIFTVRGYGHGVGMSQYGAEQMAKQGADYKQILAWYYPGSILSNDL